MFLDINRSKNRMLIYFPQVCRFKLNCVRPSSWMNTQNARTILLECSLMWTARFDLARRMNTSKNQTQAFCFFWWVARAHACDPADLPFLPPEILFLLFFFWFLFLFLFLLLFLVFFLFFFFLFLFLFLFSAWSSSSYSSSSCSSYSFLTIGSSPLSRPRDQKKLAHSGREYLSPGDIHGIILGSCHLTGL